MSHAATQATCPRFPLTACRGRDAAVNPLTDGHETSKLISTRALVQAWAAHTQRQAERARCLAVETWRQRNGAIAIARNKEMLPVFVNNSLTIRLPPHRLKRLDRRQLGV